MLGNRLVPFTAGTTTASIVFGSNNTGVTPFSRNIAVTVKDTYQPTWPVAGAVSDTSVSIAANMSDVFTVTYQLVEGSKLDLVGNTPNPIDVETAGRAVRLTTAAALLVSSARMSGLRPGTAVALQSGTSDMLTVRHFQTPFLCCILYIYRCQLGSYSRSGSLLPISHSS